MRVFDVAYGPERQGQSWADDGSRWSNLGNRPICVELGSSALGLDHLHHRPHLRLASQSHSCWDLHEDRKRSIQNDEEVWKQPLLNVLAVEVVGKVPHHLLTIPC